MMVKDDLLDTGLLIIQGSFSFGLGDLNPVDLSAKVSNRKQMVRLVKLSQTNMSKAVYWMFIRIVLSRKYQRNGFYVQSLIQKYLVSTCETFV